MVSTNLSRVSDHMKFYGLNSRSSKDRRQYAFLLDNGEVDEPRQLRGIKKDKVSGCCWHRKEAFIAKNKYGIDLSNVAFVVQNDPFLDLAFQSTHRNCFYPWKGKAYVVSVELLEGGGRQINGLQPYELQFVPCK